jgi:hypothetical protein
MLSVESQQSSAFFLFHAGFLFGTFLGGKGRPALKADDLTAICEPIV